MAAARLLSRQDLARGPYSSLPQDRLDFLAANPGTLWLSPVADRDGFSRPLWILLASRYGLGVRGLAGG